MVLAVPWQYRGAILPSRGPHHGPRPSLAAITPARRAANQFERPLTHPALGYYRLMQWWEETVHTLVVMHDWKQQKKLEAAIRDLVRLAVERARREGYEEGVAEGKRRAVN